MKKAHMKAMERSHASHKKSHGFSKSGRGYSDPIVGGESEREGPRVGGGEFAGMPQSVEMKSYPKANMFGPDVLDDTQGHINDVQGRAHMKTRKYLSQQH